MLTLSLYQRILLGTTLCLEAVLLYKILKGCEFPLRKLFLVYIISLFIPSLIIFFFYEYLVNNYWCGQRLYTYFFAAIDILHNLLKLVIIYFLYDRIYKPYPGARSLIRLLLILTTPFLLYNFFFLKPDPLKGLLWHIVYRFDSWVVIWIALLFIILAGGVYYFNLEINRRLKYILLGFLAYLAPRAIIKILADILPVPLHPIFSHINQMLIFVPLIIWILAFRSTAAAEARHESGRPAG
jgi:hypothetical protein